MIVTLDEYYATLKRVKDGPVDPTSVVKEEPDDDNITDVSAGPGVADAIPHDSERDVQDDEAASSPQDDAGQVEQSETEAPVTPISTKKRRIVASLKELMTHADDLQVCPICWIHHADFNCPRSAESEALYTTLAHLLEGGAAPVADSQMDPASTNDGPGVAETGDVDMGVDVQAGDIGDTQRQPLDADPQDVTDVEVEEFAADEAGDEPPTILPEAKPRAKARPIRRLTSNKIDWARGKPPLTGRVRSHKALELMVSTLQRNEDQEGVDYNFGGASKYLDRKREQHLVATLIDNRTGRVRFLDKTYH